MATVFQRFVAWLRLPPKRERIIEVLARGGHAH
jgi:hypothetical protein